LSQENLRSVDFGSLVMSFVLYAVNLNDSSQMIQSVRVRIKMCQLIEVLVSLKDVIGLRQEIRLRNRLLEIVISWNSDSDQVSINPFNEIRNTRLIMKSLLSSAN
jgi:hypothetical protein